MLRAELESEVALHSENLAEDSLRDPDIGRERKKAAPEPRAANRAITLPSDEDKIMFYNSQL